MDRHTTLGRVLRLLLAAALLIGACNFFDHLPQPLATAVGGDPTAAPATEVPPGVTPSTEVTESPAISIKTSSGPRFAKYDESPGEVATLISHEVIASDLNNVSNPFLLSKAQMEHLGRDGFVVSPAGEKEFYMLYEKARYNNVPIFATSDSLLHSYHLLFDKILRAAEEERFIPKLRSLNQAMLAEADRQYQALRGTAWEDPARRVVAYFSVGSRLLEPEAAIPDYAADLAQMELNNIQAASGILPSAIFPGLAFGEDYTQYIPRGHYTKSEALQRYFRAMMWYGRMTFRLKAENPEVGKAETRAALILVQALRNAQADGQPAAQAWADLYAPTAFFVGRSDDLTPTQYGDVIDAVYGPNPPVQSLVDENRLGQFIDLAGQLPPPKILGMVISDRENEEEATKGLRFMGQRFVPDAYIFRQLIYRNVSTNENRRGLPKGLDLMAAMGSERAYQHLETMGDTAYANYPEQMHKVRGWLSGLTVDEWTETLYNAWLYSFFPLLEKPEPGYPAFMLSDAWLDKQLNTSLGSWAELKHDTVLYAKQVYAEMGGGPPPPPPLPPRNYVEPVPVFYARLAALTEMTRIGLDERGLLNDEDRDALSRLEELSLAFKTMAEKELRGEPLTEEENERIRFYGGELEHLVTISAEMDTAEQGVGTPIGLAEDQQAAVIADVATDPDPGGQGGGGPIVLEEGVGRVNEIYAVVPVFMPDGSSFLQVNQGGVFSYYEFTWPAADRLTDEKWREMLDKGEVPDLPPWTASFFVPESSYDDLRVGVSRFQGDLAYVFWDPINSIGVFGSAFDQFQPELEALNQSKSYIGRQLVSSYFRSYDLQSPTRAVVTVRETWKDSRYTYSEISPMYDEAPAAQRGPYVLDATYTLEYNQESSGYGYWTVAQVFYNTAPPDW